MSKRSERAQQGVFIAISSRKKKAFFEEEQFLLYFSLIFL